MKRIASLAVALLATLILAASVSAAPSSISLDQANPSAGDTITFTVSSENGNFIYLKCWSGRPHNASTLVLSGGLPVGSSFTLSFAGAAECEAELQQFFTSGNRLSRRLASVRFDVAA